MSVPTLPRALACAAAVLALAVPVAGCSTSNDALTANNYTSADGVQADSGLVGVRNLLLVSGGSGATLSGAFANNGSTAESIVSMTLGTAKATVVASGGLAIPIGGTLTFGLPGSGPQAYLPGAFSPGLNVTLTITFAHAAPLVLRVPVLPRSGFYTAVPTPAAGAGAAA